MEKSKRKIINYAIDIIIVLNVGIYTALKHFVFTDIPRPTKIIFITTACIALLIKLTLWNENSMSDNIFNLFVLIFIIGILICGMIGIL